MFGYKMARKAASVGTLGVVGWRDSSQRTARNTKQMLAEMRKHSELMAVAPEARAERLQQIEKREETSKAVAFGLALVFAIIFVIYANTSHKKPSKPAPASPTYGTSTINQDVGGSVGFVNDPNCRFDPSKPSGNGSYQDYSEYLTFCVR